jgi:hypothetical protein
MRIRDNAAIAETPTRVSLPFTGRFSVGGTTWLISTNSADVLKAVQETYKTTDDDCSTVDLTVDLTESIEAPL